MAPEFFQNKKQSEKVDIWAVGILLYEMLHGVTPFKNLSLGEIQETLRVRGVFFKEGVAEAVKDFFYKCVQLSADKRSNIEDLLKHQMFRNIGL